MSPLHIPTQRPWPPCTYPWYPHYYHDTFLHTLQRNIALTCSYLFAHNANTAKKRCSHLQLLQRHRRQVCGVQVALLAGGGLAVAIAAAGAAAAGSATPRRELLVVSSSDEKPVM